MSRIKSREFIRRTPVAQREAEVPVLAVHADMDHTRSAGALTKTAAAVLDRATTAAVSHRVRRGQEQYNLASTQRMQEDAEGAERQSEDFVASQSAAWRRGYLKADGIIRIRDWQVEAAKVIAQAEPGADIEPILNERMAELTQHPEFNDPQVRAALMPIAQRAAQQVRQVHLQNSMQESLTRQQEAITAIIRDGIASGALFDEGGMDGLYDMLNQEEFAWLNKRDVDGLFAVALAEEMASGNRDPAEILEFVADRTDEDGVSLMDGQHGQDLRRAAAAGAKVIQDRIDEARKVALASMEFDLQDLADRGRLTDRVIVDKLASAGINPETDPAAYTQAVRYWQNQQDATLRRWEAEARERAKELRHQELLNRNPYELSDSDIRKALDEQLSNTPPGQRGPILRRAVELGVVPTYYQNVLRRADPSNPEKFREAFDFYKAVHAMSPQFAAEAAGAEMAARYEDFRRDVDMGGQSERAALNRFTAPRHQREEAHHVVSKAWKDAIKEYGQVRIGGDTVDRDERELFRIQARAEQLAFDLPGLSGEAAIAAAVGEVDAQRTEINGVRVPNRALPKGAEPAVEELVRGVAARAGLDPKVVTARPVEGTGGDWVVIGEDNLPIRDPDSGGRVLFDPRQIAATHSTWRADLAEAQTRRKQLDRNTSWRHRGDNAVIPLNASAEFLAQREEYVQARDAIPNIPEDFLDYLNRK